MSSMRRVSFRASCISITTLVCLSLPALAFADTIAISIVDDAFATPHVSINPGDVVTWTNNGQMQHTVTASDASFDSGTLSPGQTFSHTFNTPGDFAYYCKFHGTASGTGMVGDITVTGQSTVTTSSDTSGIDSLRAQIQALLAQVQALTTAASTSTVTTSGSVTRCPVITRSLAPGAAGADVSDLQDFLAAEGDYTAANSGLYDNATVLAVQKWQSDNGILSSGNVATNGWGAVGPVTRAKIASRCGDLSRFSIPGNAMLTVGQKSSTSDKRVSLTLSAIEMTTAATGSHATPSAADVAITINTCGTNTACKAPILFSSKTITVNSPATVGGYTFALTFLSTTNANVRVSASSAASTTATTTPVVIPVTSGTCLPLTHNVGLDDTDATTGGDVTRLQQFLATDHSIYPEGLITGYFGPATLRAVQRWQARAGVVSSGDPDTTGYGYVGPKTRTAFAAGCGSVITPPVVSATSTTTATSSPITITVQAPASGAFGSLVSISWATNLAPAGSGVALWLSPATVSSSVRGGLIASNLAANSSYFWSIPAKVSGSDIQRILGIAGCPQDDISICPASLASGAYKIIAELYTPASACLGGLCPPGSAPQLLALSDVSFNLTDGITLSNTTTTSSATSSTATTTITTTATTSTTTTTTNTTVASGTALSCVAAHVSYANNANVDGLTIIGSSVAPTALTSRYTCTSGYWVCGQNCGSSAGVSYVYQNGQLVPITGAGSTNTPGYDQPSQACSGNFKWCALGQSSACLPAYMCP